MTLEQARALPWYEHDALMAQVLSDGEEPEEPAEGTPENIADMGFSYQEVS